MSIDINHYKFKGPYENVDKLEDDSGVYVILCKEGKNYYPIDVGESETVKERVENHDRWNCWKKECSGNLTVAVHYVDEIERKEIEQDIRYLFGPPCGER
jgi:hypothetical protein